MRATIRPYSIAVAPDSSLAKRAMNLDIPITLKVFCCWWVGADARPAPVPLLKRDAGRGHLGVQVATQRGEGGDHDHRDEGDDQAIFDGRGAGLVIHEARNE